jgi:hypothetical protein
MTGATLEHLSWGEDTRVPQTLCPLEYSLAGGFGDVAAVNAAEAGAEGAGRWQPRHRVPVQGAGPAYARVQHLYLDISSHLAVCLSVCLIVALYV